MNQLKKLSQKELMKKIALEQTIQEHERGFIVVGEALSEIQSERLYRDEYGSFSDYCKERWGWGKSYAYRIITAAEVKMSPIGDSNENEAQAREIAKVPQNIRKEVIEGAKQLGGVTAKNIRKSLQINKDASPIGDISKGTIDLDKVGRPIPNEIWGDWVGANGLGKHLLDSLRGVRKEIETGLERSDERMAELSNAVVADVKNAETSVKRIIPHAVCPSCAGLNRENCTMCSKRGFLSKFYWESCVPEEIKQGIKE